MAGLERRGNKQKQAEQLKQGRGENVHVAIDWRTKKSQNPIKARNVRGQLFFRKMLDSPVAADNRGQQGLSIDAILRSISIRGHPRTTK